MIVNRIFGLFRARLISERAIKSIESIIEKSVTKAQDDDINDYSEGLSCIIFSKDRPLQLYALIESVVKRWDNSIHYKIIYKASDSEYENAYSACIEECKSLGLSIEWIPQNSFKEIFLVTLSLVNTKQLLFLTDDNIAITDFNCATLPITKCSNQIISLRHSPRIISSYNLRRTKIKRPHFTNLAGESVVRFCWFQG